MKILLIAPRHPDLPSIDAVIADISSYHEVTPVVGIVRESDIRREVRNGPLDIIWWATHGDANGVQISDATIDAESIGQYVGNAGARLCVLNTCASEDIAYRIIAGGDADMVFTITADVRDADAQRFDGLFAAALTETEDFQAAFTQAAGRGSTKYRYLQAKHALRGLALQTTSALERLQEKVSELTQATYEAKVDAKATRERFDSIQVQFESMRVQFESTRIQLEGVRAQFEAVRIQFLDRPEIAVSSWPVSTLIALGVIILVGLVFIAIRLP